MPIVDRLEYPKKYKLQNTMLLLAVVAALLGIWYGSCSNRSQRKHILIHSIKFEEFGRQYIRLGFDIENTGKRTDSVNLLAKVFAADGEEITSILFATDVKAQTREYQTKYIDKLNRPLQEGEKPFRATIEILQRRLFGNE